MKQMIIMVGVPGSGKSTRAEELARQAQADGLTAQIFSTDSFFMRDGKYVFVPARLGEYHSRNQSAVRKAMESGVDVVIVDNTNIIRSHRKIYADLAADAGYSSRCEVVGGFTPAECEVYAARNSHGVPLEVILKMAKKFEKP